MTYFPVSARRLCRLRRGIDEILRCDSSVDEVLVMTCRATTIDASVGIHRGLRILMPEDLSDAFERSPVGHQAKLLHSNAEIGAGLSTIPARVFA